MAAPTTQLLSQRPETSHPPKRASIKTLVESFGDLSFVPSEYTYTKHSIEEEADPNDPEFLLPIIDLSVLTSGSPDQGSKIIHHDLVEICQQWGFFILVNHGVPASLMTAMIDASQRIFNLPENEKHELHGEEFQYFPSTSTPLWLLENNVYFWRDYFKVRVHPEFFSPDKPTGFSDILLEYTKRTREVAWEITKLISESLGLEANYIHSSMNMDRGLEFVGINYYPPCHQPEHAIGQPNHTDYGLLTLLIDNGVSGLQVKHNGKWLNANRPYSNAFLVNLSDSMQMLTKNKYKGVLHRATLNKKAARISIAMNLGPSLDTVVAPASELLEREGEAPKYLAMSHKDCLQLKALGGKLPYAC